MTWTSLFRCALFLFSGILFWKILQLHLNKRIIGQKDIINEASLERSHELPLIKKGIFWSELAESYVPKGVLFTEATNAIRKYRGQVAKHVSKPSKASHWRRFNAFVILEDRTRFYAKYRGQFNAYDEVLCFYLSHLLQMDNVPLVFLTKLNTVFWKYVNIDSLQWSANETVSLVRLMNDVKLNVRVPNIIYEAFFNGVPVTGSSFSQYKSFRNTSKYVAEVIQFGSLIVLDFLAMQTDRYKRWAKNTGEYPYVPSKKTLNLAKSRNGKLWILDNEFSFFGIYFSRTFTQLNNAYDKLLKSMCVFQPTLVESLENLSKQRSFSDTFFNFLIANEPLLRNMDRHKFMLHTRILINRLYTVIRWIRHCQTLHINNKI